MVDWAQYRHVFEREASLQLGHEVRVRGETDASILPTPTLTFSRVEVGSDGDEPLMTVKEFKVRVELMPLLQRQIEVIDMQLVEPQIMVRLDESGKGNWQSAASDKAEQTTYDIKLNDVEVVDGALYFASEKSGFTRSFRQINADVSAQSLKGPWKINGSTLMEEERLDFRVATGALSDTGTLRVKSTLFPASQPVELKTDGVFEFAQANGGLRYNASFEAKEVQQNDADGKPVRGSVAGAWNASGELSLDAEQLLIRQSEIVAGTSAARIKADGTLRVLFGRDARFEALLTSRQLNLDAAFGTGDKRELSIASTWDAIRSFAQSLPRLDLPGTVGIDIPSIVLAGDVVRKVRFDAKPDGEGWRIEGLSAFFPGDSELRLDGKLLATGRSRFSDDFDISYDGDVSFKTKRITTFARWWQKDAEQARRLRLGDVDFSGKIKLASAGFAFSDIAAKLGDADLKGDISLVTQRSDTKRLDVNVHAGLIDFDALQAAASLFFGDDNLSGFTSRDEINVVLDAERVRLNRLEGKGAEIDLSLFDGAVEVRDFSVRDFAGASITAEGRVRDVLSTPNGNLRGTLKAEQLAGLLDVLKPTFSESNIFSYIVANRNAFEPMDVAIEFEGRRRQVETDISLALNGLISGGDVDLTGNYSGELTQPDKAKISANGQASYQNVRDLAAMANIELLPLDTLGSAQLTFDLQGQTADNLLYEGSLETMDVATKFEGALSQPQGGTTKFEGTISSKSDDIEPMLQAFGLTLPGFGIGADFALETSFSGTGEQISFDNYQLTYDEARTSGKIDIDLTRNVPRISGSAKTDSLSLPWFISFATGDTASDLNDFGDAAEQTLWSKRTFAPSVWPDWQANIDISADSFFVGEFNENDLVINRTEATLELDNQSLSISDLSGKFKGGEASGTLRFANDNGNLDMTGSLALSDVDASQILWQDQQRPIADGLISVSAQFDGAGRSAETIIASLGGGGAINTKGLKVRRVNSETFSKVLQAADKDEAILEKKKLTPLIASYLDSGLLNVGEVNGSFTMSSGIARLGRLTVDQDGLEAFSSASINLNDLSLQASTSLSVDAKKIDDTSVTGATPEIGITFTGDLAKPEREIDVTAFLGYLTVRQFEREVQRVEELQADIAEKQRLSRELRWQQYETARLAKEAADRALEKALEAERVKKQREQEAEARRKAEEAERLRQIRLREEEEAARLQREQNRQAQAERPIVVDDVLKLLDEPLDDTLTLERPLELVPLELQ